MSGRKTGEEPRDVFVQGYPLGRPASLNTDEMPGFGVDWAFGASHSVDIHLYAKQRQKSEM